MRSLFSLVCLLTVLAAPPAVLTAAETLTAGSAGVDITPPAGFRMSGYFTERLNTGTRDGGPAQPTETGPGVNHVARVEY